MSGEQYPELEALYSELADDGLEILAFPSGQFLNQEFATDAEIQAWISDRGFSFPVFAKSLVNGDDELPLYTFLKASLGGIFSDVKWNFGKFLVDGDGQPVKRYGPKILPSAIKFDILPLLSS